MRKYSKVLFLAVLFSFIWGVWWGLRRIPLSIPFRQEPVRLKVFSVKGILSPDLLAKLQDEKRITIDLHEADSHFDMLREILAHEQKYDVFLFSSFMLDSVILPNYFHQLHVENTGNISVDFRNLDFDPDNRHAVPVLWGVNGWLVPKSEAAVDFSLAKALHDGQHTLGVPADPAELYLLMKALHPAVQMWVQTGAETELAKELSGLKNSIHLFSQNPDMTKPEGKVLTQITNGEITPDLAEKYDFRLPLEKGHLWLILGAVARNTPKATQAADFLDLLLAPDYAKPLAMGAHMATPLAVLEKDQDLTATQKASYIRSLPISRIQLESHHEAFEPIFTGYLKSAYPSFFGVNARR